MDIRWLQSIIEQIIEDIDRGIRLEFDTPILHILKTNPNTYGIELDFVDSGVSQIQVDGVQTMDSAQELGEFIQYVLCNEFKISLDLYNSVNRTYISKRDILKVNRRAK